MGTLYSRTPNQRASVQALFPRSRERRTHQEPNDVEESFRASIVEGGKALKVFGVRVYLALFDEVRDDGKVAFERCFVQRRLEQTKERG